MRAVPVGAKGTYTLRVTPAHLANQFKDAALPQVFATPMMVTAMENAALNAVRDYLEPGESAVGTMVNVRHLAATPVGHQVTAEAEVTKVDGRRIEFKVSARDEMEVCVAKDLGASGAWLDAMSRRQRGGSMFKALTDAGLTGFPVRWIVRRSGEKDALTTLELTRFEKASVPASTFEIPAGYKKVSGYDTHMTPEQEEAMRKAMENMTPEQRKQFEEMMKKQKENN